MKKYLIIGGSTGIGRALVEQLSSEGHEVFATYNENQKTGTEYVHYFHLDVMKDELALPELPDSLDGLVYCPGSINLKPFARIKESNFISDFRLQVTGAIWVIQQCIQKLKRADTSSIVLFSTVAASQGFNFHSQVAVSKGAIQGLTKALSAEFAPKIRVNCIAPSLTQTPLAGKLLNTDDKVKANADRHPLRRIGQPKDIAATAAFLLSDDASWITGQIMHVDGGMSSIRG